MSTCSGYVTCIESHLTGTGAIRETIVAMDGKILGSRGYWKQDDDKGYLCPDTSHSSIYYVLSTRSKHYMLW